MTPKVVLLLAHTARSIAYVQALSVSGFEVSGVILYGEDNKTLKSARSLQCVNSGLFCPDLSKSLKQSLAMAEWPIRQSQSKELDHEVLFTQLSDFSPDLIVFSGYGGQIVPSSLLKIAPMLHIHSGELPEFPGSTTIYYQLLTNQKCGASAILLDENIDTGPVLATKSYSPPPYNMDIDYLYDTMIRADLLVQVLTNIERYKITELVKNEHAKSSPYYIIHPLLKHIAILSSDAKSKQQGNNSD